ncbi:MAG: hypothetical protein OXF96_03960, partial [Chloroflexi bacterium]|nr:hypothetical protein [Chloroflexota bacterium]
MDHVNDWRQPASEWEDREEFFENILQAQLAARERQVMIAALSAALIDLGKSQADIIPGGDYAINIIEHAINSSDKNIWSDIPEIVARTALLKRVARIPKINQALNRLGYIPMVGSMSISAMQEIRKVLGEELPLVDATLDRVDDARAAVADDGKPIPFSLPVDPVQIHVVSEYLYDQDWSEIPNRSGPGTETIHHGFSPNYADLERASETLGLWTNAQADWAIRNRPLSWIQEKMPDAISAVQNTRPEWFRSNKKLVDAAKNTWGEAWLNVALGPGRTFTKVGGNRMFRDDLLDLNQAEFLYFPPGDPTVGTEFPDASHEWSREAGPIWDSAYGVPFLEIGQVAGELKDFQNAAGDVEYELGMLQSGFSYTRERAGDFAATTYGLTLSTETAEQALLAAGL